MGRISVTATLLGLFLVLAASSIIAQDAWVDQHTDGTNANDFEAYWYYYDDNSGVKEDDRPQAAPTSKASVINVLYTEKLRGWGTSDTWKVKDYTFTLGTDAAGNKFATMPFTYGEIWEASYGDATPYVGIGTMLATEGKSIDLTGATGVTFKIKSRKAALAIDFKVETYDITLDSSYTYYQTAVTTTTTEWTEVTVLFTDLEQPGWTPPASEFAFDQTKVTKLAWEVAGGKNKNITGDTLDVDDIKINGYTFVSPTVWPNTAALGQRTGIFSNFEDEAYKNATSLGTYWYAYNDAEIGGTSMVVAGATANAETKRFNLLFEQGSGSNGAGAFNTAEFAPYLEFSLGKSVKQKNAVTGDSVTVQGFVGIGVNVYDSTTSTYFNASTGKRGTKGGEGSAQGIYFEYLYDGDPTYMTLEISDKSDVGDATAPTRKDGRGSGIVYYRNFQKTGLNVWKAVSVNFSDLIVHDDWKGYTAIPFDAANIAKVQFKVQGAETQGGKLFIDNLCFPGITFPGVGVSRSHVAANQYSAFTAVYTNGNIRVDWKRVMNLTNGSISLINTKGAVVQRTPVSVVGGLDATLPAGTLPAGMYFVNFKGTDTNGSSVNQKKSLTIVR